ncbi:MAG: DUF4445 domain-containing protein [Spirochaetaceae bacterium]|nr:MAG: DUF4445 domain-containing protein [Spirochaetaceae bacterium]
MNPVVHINPLDRAIPCLPGETLLDCIRRAGVRLAGDCGGRGTCGRCRVEIERGEADRREAAPVEAGSVLACGVRPRENCRVTIPPESLEANPEVLTTHSFPGVGAGAYAPGAPAVECRTVRIPPPEMHDARSDAERVRAHVSAEQDSPVSSLDYRVLTTLSTDLRGNDWTVSVATYRGEIIRVGAPDLAPLTLAVDIGTTTCALYLLESAGGREIDTMGVENPQAPRGADVVTRLAAAIHDPGHDLQRTIMEGIGTHATRLCERNGRRPEDIVHALFVGNTAMHHLFLGLPLEQLVNAPYVPATTAEITLKSRELGLPFAPGSVTRWLPNVAGYVGGDMVATLLAAGVLQNRDNQLYLDIGTNTEMCLATPERLYMLSAPSGPAFEGAHMEHGMRAAPGAIDTVATGAGPTGAGPTARTGTPFTYTTIGGGKPRGICGSGILDLICAAREQGLIDWRGRLRQGELVVVPADEAAHGRAITLSQRDIRQFQLAQGAIACGVIILARSAGISPEDITGVVVAGAFGTHINMNNALKLGMLPVPESTPIRQIGNAAGAGACLAAVDAGAAESIQTILEEIRYVELVTAPEFKTTFARATYFKRTPAERDTSNTKGAAK